MKLHFVAAVLAVFLTGVLCHAGDAASDEALAKTLKLLSDPKLRQDAISSSPSAQNADRQVQLLGSAQDTNKIYDISGLIMTELVRRSNGDVAKMQEILHAAEKNPAEFLGALPPEIRTAISEVAKNIERQSTKSPR